MKKVYFCMLTAETHTIYFPVSDYKEDKKTPVGGTFKLMVFKLK
jgi:hypothetical protein